MPTSNRLEILLEIKQHRNNLDRSYKGVNPTNGLHIAKVLGHSLWIYKPNNYGPFFKFKLVIPSHPIKANYFLNADKDTGTLQQDEEARLLEKAFPGTISKIQDQISNFLDWLDKTDPTIDTLSNFEDRD